MANPESRVNKDINIEDITTSFPIIIKKVENISNTPTNSNIFKISQIPPKKMVQVFFPNHSEKINIKFINDKELNFKITDENNITNQTKEIITNSLIYASVYASIFGIFSFYFIKAYKIINDKAKKLNERIDHATFLKLKVKMLLYAQISAREKELNYWKDTIRKAFYSHDYNEDKINKFFDLATKNFKTYETKDKKYIKEHDELKQIENFLQENDKCKNK